MSKQLPPDPHLLFSYVNRGLSWYTIISELVDNAFDDAAGNAREVYIGLRDGEVSVTDYGRGIEDINRLGSLGASASYHHEGNLGQFGVGAKGWLCKAKKLTVDTIRDGIAHRHTYAVPTVIGSSWLNAYEGSGRKASGRSYTRLTIRDLLPGAGAIFTSSLIPELQKCYWPALRDGRKIMISDDRKRPTKYLAVEALAPPSWTDHLSFESAVNGRRYKATLGILSEQVGAYSGLFVGFLYRNICIEKSLPNRAVPPRVHGQIELSEDWRHTLSNYKDTIIHDREALLLDIETRAAKLFDLADEYAEDLRLDKVALEVETVAAKAIRRSKTAHLRIVTSESGGGGGVKAPENPNREKREHKAHADLSKDDGANVASGLRVRWQRLGHDTLGGVSLKGRQITITLNRDCPKLDAQSKQPRYPGR